jgi:hypothetical protein
MGWRWSLSSRGRVSYFKGFGWEKVCLMITQTNCRIASKSWMTGSLDVGDALKMGNKDVEVSHSKSCLRVRLIRYCPRVTTYPASPSLVHQVPMPLLHPNRSPPISYRSLPSKQSLNFILPSRNRKLMDLVMIPRHQMPFSFLVLPCQQESKLLM